MGLWVYGTCGRLCGLLFVTHTPCGDWTAVSMGHLGCCVGGSRQPTPCGVRIMGVVGHVGDCVGNLRYPTHARGALFGAYGKFVGVWVTSRDPAGVIKNLYQLSHADKDRESADCVELTQTDTVCGHEQ